MRVNLKRSRSCLIFYFDNYFRKFDLIEALNLLFLFFVKITLIILCAFCESFILDEKVVVYRLVAPTDE